MKFVETYQTKWKIEISKAIISHFSSKFMFFMSKVPIVARRRRSQLATTVPVLTPPGKPSTWFPGEGLVTQAWLFHLLSNMSFKYFWMSQKPYVCHFKFILKFLKFVPKSDQFLKFRLGKISFVHLRFHLKLCMEFVIPYQTKWKIKIRKAIV